MADIIKFRKYYDFAAFIQEHIKDVSITTIFNLPQGFCSCSVEDGIHNPSCPNYNNGIPNLGSKPSAMDMVWFMKNGEIWKWRRVHD